MEELTSGIDLSTQYWLIKVIDFQLSVASTTKEELYKYLLIFFESRCADIASILHSGFVPYNCFLAVFAFDFPKS